MGTETGVEKKQSQVSGEVERQDKIITALDELVATFETRLGSVLSQPHEPHPETAPDSVDKPLVSLAGQLSGQNNRINAISLKLSSILDRLEL